MRRRPLPQKPNETKSENRAKEPPQTDSAPSEDRHYEFETFARTRPHNYQPFLTLEAKKRIAVSAGAARLFGTPDAVELRFDRHRNTVALRPVALTTPDAYRVTGRGTKSKKSGFAISAIAFCKHYGVGQEGSVRYPVEIYDGMLIANLNSPL